MYDACYREEKGEFLFFARSPKAAAWIAKHVTTNIHDTIHFTLERGREVIEQMREDGLVIGTQAESDAYRDAMFDGGEFDEPQDHCPRCDSRIGVHKRPGSDCRQCKCWNCSYGWIEPITDV